MSFLSVFGPVIGLNLLALGAFVVFVFLSRSLPKSEEIQRKHSSVILGKWVREYWWWLTSPILKALLYFKVRPNAISIAGAVMAGLSGYIFSFGHLSLGGWVMVIGASFDFFDGRVARLTNSVTDAGCFIDSSLDRVGEALTLTGLAWFYKDSYGFFIVMAVYLGSMVTSYSKARGETLGINFSGGMMQRPERIAYTGAGAILSPLFAYGLIKNVPYFANFDFYDLQHMIFLVPLAFVAFFCNLTAVHRMIRIMQLLDEKQFGKKKN